MEQVMWHCGGVGDYPQHFQSEKRFPVTVYIRKTEFISIYYAVYFDCRLYEVMTINKEHLIHLINLLMGILQHSKC